MTASVHSHQVLLGQLFFIRIGLRYVSRQTNSKLSKALHSFSKTIQKLFQCPEIQGLFEAGLEFNAATRILVDST